MANEAPAKLDGLFARMYEAGLNGGRPSTAPEDLLRAMLLQVFFGMRSERPLMEQTQYNLVFRWFIGLSMDDSVWVPTVFTKSRERLIGHDAVVAFFNYSPGFSRLTTRTAADHEGRPSVRPRFVLRISASNSLTA